MELYIKKEITTSNYGELLWGAAEELLDACSDDERERVLSYVAEILDGDIPTDQDIVDLIYDSKDDIVRSLGYESGEHFDFVKENDLTSGDYCYEKDGDYYTADDLQEKWDAVESACDEAMCDYPYSDFDDYIYNNFEELETP